MERAKIGGLVRVAGVRLEFDDGVSVPLSESEVRAFTITGPDLDQQMTAIDLLYRRAAELNTTLIGLMTEEALQKAAHFGETSVDYRYAFRPAHPVMYRGKRHGAVIHIDYDITLVRQADG